MDENKECTWKIVHFDKKNLVSDKNESFNII